MGVPALGVGLIHLLPTMTPPHELPTTRYAYGAAVWGGQRNTGSGKYCGGSNLAVFGCGGGQIFHFIEGFQRRGAEKLTPHTPNYDFDPLHTELRVVRGVGGLGGQIDVFGSS